MRTRLRHFASAALAALLPCAVHAQAAPDACGADVYAAVGRQLHAAGFTPAASGGNVVAAACKPWSYDDATLLAAFAYGPKEGDAIDLAVATLDRKTLRIVRAERKSVTEDALTEVDANSLRLDTARYQLDKTTRAFGLRFESAARGASCADAAWSDDLTLYVPDGARLRPVLADLSMHRVRALQGCIGSAQQDNIAEEAHLTIGVEPTQSHGYADLAVSAAIQTFGADGHAAARPRTERWILRYDGTRYRAGRGAPWWLGG